MGTARAPVSVSGRWPACNARVAKPNTRSGVEAIPTDYPRAGNIFATLGLRISVTLWGSAVISLVRYCASLSESDEHLRSRVHAGAVDPRSFRLRPGGYRGGLRSCF